MESSKADNKSQRHIEFLDRLKNQQLLADYSFIPRVVSTENTLDDTGRVGFEVEKIVGSEWFEMKDLSFEDDVKVGIKTLEQCQRIFSEKGILLQDRGARNILLSPANEKDNPEDIIELSDGNLYKVWQVDVQFLSSITSVDNREFQERVVEECFRIISKIFANNQKRRKSDGYVEPENLIEFASLRSRVLPQRSNKQEEMPYDNLTSVKDDLQKIISPQ